jgi:DNA polymerase III delta prime subunit
LISPPRKQADEETNHLMSLKTVFLGYIRQLNQTDLLFVRHIQEDDKAMDAAGLGEYSKRITEVMDNAMSQIKETTQQQKKTKNKTQEKTT